MAASTCEKCGTDSRGALFCPSCGQRVGAPVTPTPLGGGSSGASVLEPLPGRPTAPGESDPQPVPSTPTAPRSTAPIQAPPPRVASLGGGAVPRGYVETRWRRPGVLAAISLAVVVLLVVAWAASTGGSDPTARDSTDRGGAAGRAGSGASSPDDGADPTDDEPQEAVARCWDGTLVARSSQACPAPTTLRAMRWAFPIDWSQCIADTGAPYNQWSHSCVLRGMRVHVAAYRGAAQRGVRLSSYGACSSIGGGRLVCEPSATDRYVRTYRGDIMFYMSAAADARDVLLALPQRSVEELRSGIPEQVRR